MKLQFLWFSVSYNANINGNEYKASKGPLSCILKNAQKLNSLAEIKIQDILHQKQIVKAETWII